MSHPDEHEAKARKWLYWRDKTKSTDIDSLVALLRSVDAEARREEAEKKDAEHAEAMMWAQDEGAKQMLDAMERSLKDGGKFSDERANRFVEALKRG